MKEITKVKKCLLIASIEEDVTVKRLKEIYFDAINVESRGLDIAAIPDPSNIINSNRESLWIIIYELLDYFQNNFLDENYRFKKPNFLRIDKHLKTIIFVYDIIKRVIQTISKK